MVCITCYINDIFIYSICWFPQHYPWLFLAKKNLQWIIFWPGCFSRSKTAVRARPNLYQHTPKINYPKQSKPKGKKTYMYLLRVKVAPKLRASHNSSSFKSPVGSQMRFTSQLSAYQWLPHTCHTLGVQLCFPWSTVPNTSHSHYQSSAFQHRAVSRKAGLAYWDWRSNVALQVRGGGYFGRKDKSSQVLHGTIPENMILKLGKLRIERDEGQYRTKTPSLFDCQSLGHTSRLRITVST